MSEQAIGAGRNMRYEGQHAAEDPADTATRLALVREIERLRAALETIAGFAPGNGDVCEIIAKRARDALRP